jgi:ABC-type dipeptide/oligopeptide/nickel transport system permease subunit
VKLALRAGGTLIAAVVLLALAGPALAPHDPLTSDFVHGATPMHTPVGPSAAFWLGADRLYRDVFARLATGARLSLLIGLTSTLVATVIGGAVGLVAGWFEGTLVDVVLMRAVDVGLAFPFLLIVMAVGAALDHTTPFTVILILGLTGWLSAARVVRAKTMQVRARTFIDAARALGQSPWGIVWTHVLPNVRDVLFAIASVSVAQMILAEAALGYLGVGVPPPTPTWGRMLFEGQDYYVAAPWLVAAPATAIIVAVLGFHLIGEGVRGALDAGD